MKKYLTLLIALIILLSSCSLIEDNKEKVDIKLDDKKTNDKKEINSPLFNSDSIMLEAHMCNWGLVNEKDDYLKNKSYKLTYSGDLYFQERYNLSGIKNKKETKIYKEDLETIYDLLVNKVQTEKNYEAVDGDGWRMIFYDENSEKLYDYNGYIYHTKKEEIIKLLDPYIQQK